MPRTRFGLKAREALVITLLTFLVGAALTLFHLSQLSRIVIEEASHQAELTGAQIYAQASRALSRTPRGSPREMLRTDQELRSLLDASVGYAPYLLYALMADTEGRAILHSEPEKEGSGAPERPSVESLLALGPVRRFRALYLEGKTYEATLSLSLDGQPFGSIRLGIGPSLLRGELNAALRQSFAVAGIALPVASLVALGLASMTLRPIRRLTEDVGRLRRGELEGGGDLSPAGELGELAAELQRLGEEIRSDRLKKMSEKSRLEQVVDYLEDGFILLSNDRRILFSNAAAETMLATSLGPAGRPILGLLKPAHPLRSFLDRAFDHGLRNATITLPRDGGAKELLVSACLVTDAQQRLGTMLLLRDLESIKTIRSVVSHSARVTALSRLTSGVAHEVRNPLNAMMIHLELLKEKLGSLPEDVQPSLDVIGSEIRRLDRAVQGFLKFIRPQEPALKPVDVNALLADVATFLEAEWLRQGIRFALRFDPALPDVAADEELLRQAFLNILLNACQAMATSGTVSIVTEREGADLVKVSVTDQGVGIASGDLDRIFLLYYTTKPEGSGIGLSMVYRIVQLHEGTIEVSSEVGRGTTMSVRLPVR